MGTHRERVLKALRHQEPDRVPVDLGGTDVTGIMVRPYRALRDRLGLEPRPVRVVDVMQQCVWVDEDVSAALDVDAISVPYLPRAWHAGRAYDGLSVEYPAKFCPEVLPDGSQVVRTSEGQVDLRMSAGGFYFDPVLHPLQEATDEDSLDALRDVIDGVDRPSWTDLGYEAMAQYAKKLRETTDGVLVGQFSGHIFQAAQILRGWESFMVDLLANPSLAEGLMDRLAEAHMRAFEQYAATVGKYVDIVEVTDDLGVQNGLWLKPDLYRNRVKRYHARLYAFIKSRCDALLFMHSDGAIAPLIPDLIEMGVDILNPVQYTAAGMDAARLKREYGKQLSFWGGGIDTQQLLPFGSPQQVADEVRRQLDILAPDGGFVFAAVHNIQDGVPVENIMALFDTVAQHGHY